jgi:diguanylate cyclase (GGDEF)-like protein
MKSPSDVNGNAVNETLNLPLADSFEKDLTQALEVAQDFEVVVLAMIDLDHFMQVNTNYGHSIGDKVLIATGEYLKKNLPDDVRLYRYSGDEFAMLFLNKMEKEEVLLFMESLRKGFDIKTPDNIQQTISVGIAAAPEDGTRYHDLVRKADGAMYRGKANGKNRVCLAREEKMVTKTSHYTTEQLQRLTKLSKREGIGEAILLREALDTLLKKYDI